MLKTVRIGNKDYNMKSSAFTPFKYENDYGTDFLKDINQINKMNVKISELPEEERNNAWMDELSGIMKLILRIAYTMIIEYDGKFMSYEEWLKELDNIFADFDWVQEVMECAMSTFQRRVENK